MDIVHMKTLIAVIEESGFTAAAARLGIAKSVCSRRITDLETDLGVQLVNRTTRSVVPTDLGHEYYESCLDILARIDAATGAVKGANSSVAGRLRLSLPIGYTEAVLGEKLDLFSQENPDVELVDDSALYARKIGTAQIHMCAAPSYLEKYGTPKDFDDLSNHTCIRYNNLSSGVEWQAWKDGQEVRKRIVGRMSSNSGAFNLSMAIKGRGIVMQPDFIIGDTIETGALVPILTDYTLPVVDINILYPQKRNMPASLRALITHLQPHK